MADLHLLTIHTATGKLSVSLIGPVLMAIANIVEQMGYSCVARSAGVGNGDGPCDLAVVICREGACEDD